jgi:hypothetical protein
MLCAGTITEPAGTIGISAIIDIEILEAKKHSSTTTATYRFMRSI